MYLNNENTFHALHYAYIEADHLDSYKNTNNIITCL